MPTINCRVCHRPLRALISVALGVGPVCVKRARAEMATLVNQLRDPRASATANFQQMYGLSQEELRVLSEQATRTAYLERVRHGRSTRPSTERIIVTEDSRTRRTHNEPVAVEWLTDNTSLVHSSGSDRGYITTEHHCTCQDYRFHVVRHPETRPNGCRHMEAYRDALGIAQQHRDRTIENGHTIEPQQVVSPTPEIIMPTHTIARPGFAGIDTTDDALREQVLAVWRENRAWDGIRMTEDQAAFDQLMADAEAEWEYVTDGSILGGTGNTFGVELEMEFTNDDAWNRVARDLFNEGLSQYNSRQQYHTPGRLWVPTRDGSLRGGGLEIVSPILQDRPEDWAQLERVVEIAKFHGAVVNDRTGCHTNIGAGPQDSRTFSWQRLARAAVAHEAALFRMGGANSESYRRRGMPGEHRGTSYVSPMDPDLAFSGNVSPEIARRNIGNQHSSMLNTLHDNRIEFRTPNGTLDAKQVQANVIVANAMMHQAATITTRHPLDNTTPKFSERDKHLRYRGLSRMSAEAQEQAETENFKRFLDFLGHSVNRKAAAWLWKRGRSGS